MFINPFPTEYIHQKWKFMSHLLLTPAAKVLKKIGMNISIRWQSL